MHGFLRMYWVPCLKIWEGCYGWGVSNVSKASVWVRVMLQAKKILEWSFGPLSFRRGVGCMWVEPRPSPKEALQRCIRLNDRYELDGQCPSK